MRVSTRQTQKRERIERAVYSALRRRREDLGLSMLVVSERAGISQQMVSYVERGMRTPSLETLLRMSEALGLRLSSLLRRAEDEAG